MTRTSKILPVTAGIVVLVIIVSTPSQVLADSAAVLPENVSRGYWDFYHYQPTTQRYNPDGDREDLTYPFTNAPLDSDALTLLKPFDPLVGGTASIGDVSVAYQYDIDVLDAGYSYGLTDKLTLGFHIPYYWITNNVETSFDSSSANVGKNPDTGICCELISDGGEEMNEDDVQNLIGSVYGINRIETWDNQGIGDIELGMKYQLFLKDRSAFAITSGLRIPTGYEDDPDYLNDVPWSYGNYAVLLRLHYDYLVSSMWNKNPTKLHQIIPATGDVILNLTFRYDYMLPDEKWMRVGDDPNQLFTNNIEKVSRKLGDLFNVEVSGKYQLTPAIALTGLYTYSFKLKDDISGELGYNYESLEANTDSSHHIIVIAASYSTLAAYTNKQFSVPMEINIAYRDRFAGEGPRNGQANPVLDTSWVVVGMKVLF
jgi:hypothetical protein